TGTSKATPLFERCCKKGTVVLEEYQIKSDLLGTLMTEMNSESKHFRQNITEYNCSLLFTAVQYTPDERLARLSPGIKYF
ncbi:unnamed protein product, partial [Tuber aestivum]